MNVYLISGLGADQRMFQKLEFPEGYTLNHIEWIKPVSSESLQAYSKKLTTQIDTSKEFTLIGLSFGGIIATEIAKIIRPSKIIIISSARNHAQFPFYFNLVCTLKLYKLLPSSQLTHSNFIINWFFGTETIEDKNLLREILNDTDSDFLKWAIERILTWKNTIRVENLVHIHGTDDRILPCKKMHPDYKIRGGHFMVFNKHQTLNKIITEILGDSNRKSS